MARRRSEDLDRMLGARIRAVRSQKGLSLAQLGRAVGVTLQQFQKYESGETRLAVSTVFRIAEALDVGVDSLLTDLGRDKPTLDSVAQAAVNAELTRSSVDRITACVRTISDPDTLSALEHIMRALSRARQGRGRQTKRSAGQRPGAAV